MPSNARTKALPPIIAAAKSALGALKQLHRATAADLLANRDAGRLHPAKRNGGRSSR